MEIVKTHVHQEGGSHPWVLSSDGYQFLQALPLGHFWVLSISDKIRIFEHILQMLLYCLEQWENLTDSGDFCLWEFWSGILVNLGLYVSRKMESVFQLHTLWECYRALLMSPIYLDLASTSFADVSWPFLHFLWVSYPLNQPTGW